MPEIDPPAVPPPQLSPLAWILLSQAEFVIAQMGLLVSFESKIVEALRALSEEDRAPLRFLAQAEACDLPDSPADAQLAEVLTMSARYLEILAETPVLGQVHRLFKERVGGPASVLGQSNAARTDAPQALGSPIFEPM